MVATAEKNGLRPHGRLLTAGHLAQYHRSGLPLETPVEEAVVCFGYDRSRAEIYLFHALECLQCMLERRKGGETGVKR